LRSNGASLSAAAEAVAKHKNAISRSPREIHCKRIIADQPSRQIIFVAINIAGRHSAGSFRRRWLEKTLPAGAAVTCHIIKSALSFFASLAMTSPGSDGD
jgi:hypothetical protein